MLVVILFHILNDMHASCMYKFMCHCVAMQRTCSYSPNMHLPKYITVLDLFLVALKSNQPSQISGHCLHSVSILQLLYNHMHCPVDASENSEESLELKIPEIDRA